LNYELSGGRFIVQVAMKLVDADSAATIANARNFSYSEIEHTDRLFEDNASLFIQVFRDSTSTLIAECIEDLGLRI
jgi:hypothetical protein